MCPVNCETKLDRKGYWIEILQTSYPNGDDDELFCGMVDPWKTVSLISSPDHCQRPHHRESPTRRK